MKKLCHNKLPDGIENIPADWAKIKAVAGESLTQHRAQIKKETRRAADSNMNMYNFARCLLSMRANTNARPNVQFCSQLAVLVCFPHYLISDIKLTFVDQRATYVRNNSGNFWDNVNEYFRQLCAKSGGNEHKVQK